MQRIVTATATAIRRVIRAVVSIRMTALPAIARSFPRAGDFIRGRRNGARLSRRGAGRGAARLLLCHFGFDEFDLASRDTQVLFQNRHKLEGRHRIAALQIKLFRQLPIVGNLALDLRNLTLHALKLRNPKIHATPPRLSAAAAQPTI